MYRNTRGLMLALVMASPAAATDFVVSKSITTLSQLACTENGQNALVALQSAATVSVTPNLNGTTNVSFSAASSNNTALAAALLAQAAAGGDTCQTAKEISGESNLGANAAQLQASSLFTGRILAQMDSMRGGVGGIRTAQNRAASNSQVAGASPVLQNGPSNMVSAFGLNGAGAFSNGLNGATSDGGDWAADESQDDRVWLLGTHLWGEIDPRAGQFGVDYEGDGIIIGRSWQESETTLWGVHGGFIDTDADTIGAVARSQSESWNIGGHGSWSRDNRYVDGILGYARNDFDRSRTIGAVGTPITSQSEGDEVSLYLETGWILDLEDDDDEVDTEDEDEDETAKVEIESDAKAFAAEDHGKGAHKSHKRVDHKNVEPEEEPAEVVEEEEEEEVDNEHWFIQPQVAINARHLAEDAYTEAGVGALSVRETEQDTFQTAIGARFFRPISLDSGGWLVPDLRIRWGHEFGDTSTTQLASFVGDTTVFSTRGPTLDRDTAQVRVGVTGYTVKNLDFDLSWNGDFASGQKNQAAVLRVVRRF